MFQLKVKLAFLIDYINPCSSNALGASFTILVVFSLINDLNKIFKICSFYIYVSFLTF